MITSSILLRPSKKIFKKFNFFKKKEKGKSKESLKKELSYTQVSKNNINEIVKIKENFPNLSTKKIEEMQKVINELKKDKLRFNMTTKESSRQQVLVSISLANLTKLIVLYSKHIANINSALKDIKLDIIMADFI